MLTMTTTTTTKTTMTTTTILPLMMMMIIVNGMAQDFSFSFGIPSIYILRDEFETLHLTHDANEMKTEICFRHPPYMWVLYLGQKIETKNIASKMFA